MNRIDLPQCTSTSDHLKALIAQGELMEDTWVTTPNQTSGRGQRGNTWISSPNSNISASFYKTWPAFPVEKSFLISQYIATVLVQWLVDLGLTDTQLKWPNDLFVGTKKVGGVLIENGVHGKNITYSVIGIGINVLQQEFGSVTQATSMALEGLHMDSLETITTSLVDRVTQAVNDFDVLLEDRIAEAFHRYMYARGSHHWFEHQRLGLFQAVVVGTDQQGQLVLEVNQEPMSFGLQEVSWVFTPTP
jgi:BirA family biotin operon repressor/biotin-[acetyl-CoA-carboxylase] ligase